MDVGGGLDMGLGGGGLSLLAPGLGGSAAMQAAGLQAVLSDQQQAMTIGTVGGLPSKNYLGPFLPGAFGGGIGNFLGF
ncbi:MAG: hypothetical protein AB1758_05785, partial [Candidatus Eremiobacterota bacterium]